MSRSSQMLYKRLRRWYSGVANKAPPEIMRFHVFENHFINENNCDKSVTLEKNTRLQDVNEIVSPSCWDGKHDVLLPVFEVWPRIPTTTSLVKHIMLSMSCYVSINMYQYCLFIEKYY